MTPRALRYSVGNENSPTDPWGRSELVIQPGGRTRLDHHFSCGRGTRAVSQEVIIGHSQAQSLPGYGEVDRKSVV